MEYFLEFLLTAVCGFVCVLVYFDLSPKAALYKVIHRFFDSPEGFPPVKHDAPYRRAGVTPNGLRRPVLLNLETSDGSGQACHPDVVHIPGGFGSENWTYWMACTPYPYADSSLENPEIFVSYDGVNWAIPDGVQNPLVPKPKNAGDHNSDPDLLFHENELWLFFRETLRNKTPVENKIYLMKSTDGVRWSAPLEVLSEKTGTQLLSPATLHDRSCFWMWTVEIQGGELMLMRRSSPDGITWSASPQAANIIGLKKGRQPWHIDVVREKDRLSAVLVSCTGLGGGGSRLHYAHSEDHGLTWFDSGFLFEQVYEFEAKIQYRATLRKVDDQTQEYELWYSAASLTNVFSIAYLRLIRRENKLLPCELRSLQSETLTPLK